MNHRGTEVQRAVELNVNGILTLPSDADGWTDRACTIAHIKHGIYAEKLENFTGIVTRMFRQERKAKLVAMVANKYIAAGWKVYLRGHSNGCDIIRRALNHIDPRDRWPAIEAIQFIAPATEADFEKGGLNSALWLRYVGRIVVCWGPRDGALLAASLTHPLLNLFGNGFGRLGLVGPQNVEVRLQERVISIEDKTFGHSDWLSKENISATLNLMYATRNEVRGIRPSEPWPREPLLAARAVLPKPA